jgi:hypothetical protein
LASRDSFQKRQKEAARREKRQVKLDRRQGRQPSHSDAGSETDASTNPVDPDGTPLTPPETPSTESVSTTPSANAAAAPNERGPGLFKPAPEPEPPKNDSPPREP